MIDLKCCTVLVNNKAEYIALIKEAQKVTHGQMELL